MLRRYRSLLTRLSIAIGLCIGQYLSVSYAFEGALVLPSNGKSIIEYEIRSEQADVDPSDVFLVFVGSRDECCEGKSPIAGRYSMAGRTVTFVPAFDFIEGQSYTIKVRRNNAPDDATNDAANNDASLFNEFTVERSIVKVAPEIVAIYPSGKVIPENTLRFYIHFSTPMKPHVSNDYIKLVDAAGTADTAAFMAFKQELWSEDRKRLTLLMDPGRIKRGVAQNRTLGPALREGSTYSIVVDEGWPTASGADSMPSYESAFTVSKALRTLPDPAQWKIALPNNLTGDPLVIEFERPYDHELLLSGISVLDDNGKPVVGEVTIENNEHTWRFDPHDTWRHSRIQIAINTQLEDVAGNNFIELLDHAVGTASSKANRKLITLDLKSSPN